MCIHMYVFFISCSVGKCVKKKKKKTLSPSLLLYMCTKVINLVALQQLHPRCCFGKGCYKVWVSKCWRRSIRREMYFLAFELEN